MLIYVNGFNLMASVRRRRLLQNQNVTFFAKPLADIIKILKQWAPKYPDNFQTSWTELVLLCGFLIMRGAYRSQ